MQPLVLWYSGLQVNVSQEDQRRMEDPSPSSPADETRNTEDLASQPGAQAVEALTRAIAQEFVLAFAEFHDAVLADDQSSDQPKVQAAGS